MIISWFIPRKLPHQNKTEKEILDIRHNGDFIHLFRYLCGWLFNSKGNSGHISYCKEKIRRNLFSSSVSTPLALKIINLLHRGILLMTCQKTQNIRHLEKYNINDEVASTFVCFTCTVLDLLVGASPHPLWVFSDLHDWFK